MLDRGRLRRSAALRRHRKREDLRVRRGDPRVSRAGGRAIVLVPEISLTPQTARRFEAAFGRRVAVLHSALSERERFDAWQACVRDEIDVVVGARSAVFAPLQRRAPHRRRRVARNVVQARLGAAVPRRCRRARTHAARKRRAAALGSATPSIESYAAARSGKLGLIELPERATNAAAAGGAGRRPRARVRSRQQPDLQHAVLVQALGERLETRREERPLRQSARQRADSFSAAAAAACRSVRAAAYRSSAHRSEGLLRCHYCDFQDAASGACARRAGWRPSASSGSAPKRSSEEVRRLFPSARVMRMDSDSTTRVGDHARIWRSSKKQATCSSERRWSPRDSIIPRSRWSASSPPTSDCMLPDFRAAERSFGLIAQVCGRSGRRAPGRGDRADLRTRASRHCRSPPRHDYDGFARTRTGGTRSRRVSAGATAGLSRRHRAQPDGRA